MIEEETINSKKLFRRRLKKNISDDDSDRAVEHPVESSSKDKASDKEDLPTASSSKQNPTRQIRRIKRKVLHDFEAELGSESEEQPRDREDESFAVDERLQKMKKRILKTKKPKNDQDSDKELFSDDSNSNPRNKKKKREANTQARKPKKAQKARQEMAANLVKTSNKLIGEIENNDIYGSDNDYDNDGFNTGFGNGGISQALDHDEDYRGQNIQIDIGPVVKKDDEKKFLKKMKTKKEFEESNQGLESEIVNLGMLVEPG